MDHRAIREQCARVLSWEEAHVGLEKAVDGLAVDARGAVPAGFSHSAWQLLEHIRIAQEDILDFCVNAAYTHTRAWPDEYWPKTPAPPSERAWTDSIAACARSREGLERIAREAPDLTALVPTGTGQQSYLRAILLAADHAAYHVGQIVAVRRALGAWS
jgi:uncharacterized damage-inducible protein DinB